MAKYDRLIQIIDEINEFIEPFREIDAFKEKAERIIAEVEELKEVLSSPQPDEVKGFKLLRMFLEKVRDFNPNIPLLTQFLELYIAAMRSTEVFIDQLLTQYTFLARLKPHYTRLRKGKEEQLREADPDRSQEDIDREAHSFGMAGIGSSPAARYADEMKKCYELKRTKEEIAKEIRDRQLDIDSMPLPVPGLPSPTGPVTPTPEPEPEPEPISIEDIIKFIIASMRERLSDEEFEEFIRNLREMFPPLPPD